MAVRWLASPGELPAADRAALDARRVSLFDGLAWTADFSATVERADAQAAWLQVRDARSSLALPLWRVRRRLGPLRVAAVESLSNYYTMRWQPLAVQGDEAVDPSCIEAPLWQAAARALAGAGASVSLAPLDAQAGWVAHLAEALAAQGCSVHRTEAFGNWVAHVGGQRFDDWFARRPAALRNTWRRRGRQLRQRARIAFELHGAQDACEVRDAYAALGAGGSVVWADGGRDANGGRDAGDGPDAGGIGGTGRMAPGRSLDEAIAAFDAVYRRSWKQPEPHPRFMPTLIRRAAAHGALRLGLLSADGAPIAAQLWLRDGDATVIYKLAYDQAWKPFSPGLALSIEMFRHAIEVDRVALVDYGSGDDAYKRDWMDERRVRVALTAYPRRHPVGALMAARARWRDAARARAG